MPPPEVFDWHLPCPQCWPDGPPASYHCMVCDDTGFASQGSVKVFITAQAGKKVFVKA